MNKIILIFTLSLLFMTCGCNEKNYDYPINPTSDSNFPDGIYIPKDINDCFVELKKMLPPDLIKEFKEENQRDLVQYHFSLGLWLRNNWGLWKGSRLQEYMIELGFRHPDDMSGAIIESFWLHLNGKPIEFEKQAEASKYYWQIHAEPNEPICPEHNVTIEMMYQLYGSIMKANELLPRCIHVGRCSETKTIWAYEFDRGWYKPPKEILNRIEELEAEGTENLVAAPIEKP